MRKLLLLMGLCILLSSFCNAVQIWDMPAPLLNITWETGGTLTPGDTYYMICFYQVGRSYYGTGVSPASKEINFTVNSTHTKPILNHGWMNGSKYVHGFWTPSNTTFYSINSDRGLGLKCKWDNYTMMNTTTGEYLPWLNYNNPHTVIDYQDGHHKWTAPYHTWNNDMDWVYPHKNITLWKSVFKDDGGINYKSSNTYHPQVAWRDPNSAGGYKYYGLNNLGNSFNMSHGTLAIELQNGDNWCSMIQALLSNESYSDRFLYLGQDAVDSCENIDYQRYLTVFGGIFESVTDGINVDLTKKDITIYGSTCFDGDCTFIDFSGGQLSFVSGTLWNDHAYKIDNTKILSDSGSFILGALQGDRGISMWKTNGGGYTLYYGNDLNGYNFLDITSGTFNHRYPYDDGYITNTVFENSRVSLTLRNNNGDNLTYQNITFINNGLKNYDYYEDWYTGQTDPVNTNWYNCVSDREDGIIYFKYDDPATPALYVNHTVYSDHHYYLTQNNGTEPVSNATITETDAQGNTYTSITDSVGYTKITVVNYEVYNDDAVHVDRLGNYSYMKPYNVSINKPGFIEKEIVIEDYGEQTRHVKLETIGEVIGDTLVISPGYVVGWIP